MVSKIANISLLRGKSDQFLCLDRDRRFYLFMGPGQDLKLPRVLREKGLPLYRDGKPLPSRAQHPRVGFCQTLVFTERSDRSGLALSRFTRLSPLYAGTLSRARYSSLLDTSMCVFAMSSRFLAAQKNVFFGAFVVVRIFACLSWDGRF